MPKQAVTKKSPNSKASPKGVQKNTTPKKAVTESPKAIAGLRREASYVNPRLAVSSPTRKSPGKVSPKGIIICFDLTSH